MDHCKLITEGSRCLCSCRRDLLTRGIDRHPRNLVYNLWYVQWFYCQSRYSTKQLLSSLRGRIHISSTGFSYHVISAPFPMLCICCWKSMEWNLMSGLNSLKEIQKRSAWVAQALSVNSWYWLSSRTHWLWDQVPHQTLHWLQGAYLGFSLSLSSAPPAHSHSLEMNKLQQEKRYRRNGCS